MFKTLEEAVASRDYLTKHLEWRDDGLNQGGCFITQTRRQITAAMEQIIQPSASDDKKWRCLVRHHFKATWELLSLY